MEKENVLEVKIVKMNDKYSLMTITKQDDEVIRRNEFTFTANNNIQINSWVGPGYTLIGRNIFYIWGNRKDFDDLPVTVPNEDIPLIEQAIKELNEKYGKSKRWRAEKGKKYYFVSQNASVLEIINFGSIADNELYNCGNYFRTQEQAEECKKRIKKVFDDYHQEIGE